MELTDRLKTARKYAGLKQYELADKIGTKRTYVSQCETGSENPSTRYLKLASLACNVNEDWLINGVGEMESRDDEVSKIVAGIINDPNNPRFSKIVDFARMYLRLSDESQVFFDALIEAMVEKYNSEKS